MSEFDAFLEAAWAEHAEHPAEVADRIAASLDLVTQSERVEPFVRLLAHVYGEHLGAYDAAVALLETLASRELCAPSAAARAIPVRIAALRHAAGSAEALAGLSPDESVTALALAAAMLAGRHDHARAIELYRHAVQRSARVLPKASPVARALAVAGNNLACALEEHPQRSAEQTAGMVMAAECALAFWKIAGTWLEEERAEYRLARSLLAAGRADAAVRAAQRCIDVCEVNDAPVMERFFGHVALALAHAAGSDGESFETACAKALALHETISHDERAWCEADLSELRRARAAPQRRAADASSSMGAMSATSSAGE